MSFVIFYNHPELRFPSRKASLRDSFISICLIKKNVFPNKSVQLFDIQFIISCLCHLQHLPSQTDGLSDVLGLVVPQPAPVLAEGGGVEGHLPGESDLAVALVQVDVRFVEEEGEDAGVKSVSDDHSGAAEHRY